MNEEFRKKIIEDFGLNNMDSRQQDDMIERIGNMLFESVVEKSIDGMDEQGMKEFDETIDAAGGDYQKILGFLQEKVPDFGQIVTDELSRLKRATSGIFA